MKRTPVIYMTSKELIWPIHVFWKEQIEFLSWRYGSSINFRSLFRVFRLFIKRPLMTLFVKSGGYSTKADQDIGMEQKEGNYTRFWRKIVSDSRREILTLFVY